MYSWEVGEGMDVINQYKYAARYNNWPPPHTHTLLLICCLISHPKFVPLDLQHVFASPGLFDLFLYDKGKEGDIYIYIYIYYIYLFSFSLSPSLLFLPIYLSNQSFLHTGKDEPALLFIHPSLSSLFSLSFYLTFSSFFSFTQVYNTPHIVRGFPTCS